MSQDFKKVKRFIQEIESIKSIEKFAEQLLPRDKNKMEELANKTYSNKPTKEGIENRIEFLEEKNNSLDYIKGEKQFNSAGELKGNIENFIGMAQIPVGLAGPLLVNGTHANGDFHVPLATTEGALVWSYHKSGTQS